MSGILHDSYNTIQIKKRQDNLDKSIEFKMTYNIHEY